MRNVVIFGFVCVLYGAYILGTYVIRGFLIKIIKYVVRKNNTTYVARLAAKYAQNT